MYKNFIDKYNPINTKYNKDSTIVFKLIVVNKNLLTFKLVNKLILLKVVEAVILKIICIKYSPKMFKHRKIKLKKNEVNIDQTLLCLYSVNTLKWLAFLYIKVHVTILIKLYLNFL